MYESEQTTLTDALQASNPTVFNEETISQILALASRDNNNTIRIDKGIPDGSGKFTVPSGAEVVLVESSNTFSTTVNPPANAPVVIFQGKGGVVATLNDATATVPSSDQTKVDRVVVGSAGNDLIVVADAKNTKIVLGTGDSTVGTGQGVDTVVAGLGNSTIIGGSGDYAVVKLGGNASNYNVTSQNGHAIVTNTTTNKVTDISKIQYVQLDNGNALVFARNSVEGQVAQLYRVAFGRDADAGGLDYWFDAVKAGATLKQVARSFVASTEYSNLPSKSNLEFIQGLYQNTFNRAGEDAGVAYWLDQLSSGRTKAEIISNFAEIAIQNIQNTAASPEVQVVGSVNIINGII